MNNYTEIVELCKEQPQVVVLLLEEKDRHIDDLQKHVRDLESTLRAVVK